MEGFVSVQDHPVLKEWKLLLEEWNVDYDIISINNMS